MHKSSEIKALRKRMGLTRPGFALAVGCTSATVRNWEHGRAIQPRYRVRLDDVAKAAAAAPRSVAASAGQPVAVLVVEDGDNVALFCAGRKPLVGKSFLGSKHETIATAWLGAGIRFTLTVAEVTAGALAPAY